MADLLFGSNSSAADAADVLTLIAKDESMRSDQGHQRILDGGVMEPMLAIIAGSKTSIKDEAVAFLDALCLSATGRAAAASTTPALLSMLPIKKLGDCGQKTRCLGESAKIRLIKLIFGLTR